MSNPNYDAVREDIKKIMPKEDWDNGSLGPILVRLAWHSSGTYDARTKTGGSNGGTMRFHAEGNDPANAGLEHARAFLEPIKEKHPWITYGDLWTLAGVVAIEELGGPIVPWKPGRKDKVKEDEKPPTGRLPDASQGEKHIRDVFNRMGFNDREIVALIGAHSLGRCHKDRSGYEGPWTHTPKRFSTQFYKLLLNEKWVTKEVNGNLQYENVTDSPKKLMMLPTDMALLADPEFKKIVEEYAANKQAFFDDFSAAFGKLLDLGVSRSSGTETVTC